MKNIFGKAIFIGIIIAFFFGCKKENRKGQITTNDIAGSWQLVCRFVDVDSNGLTEKDIKYNARPSDSIMWKLESDNAISYIVKGQTIQSGYWYLTWPNKKKGSNELFLNRDPDYESYSYFIGSYTKNHLVIYCKTFEMVFSKPKFYWKGWELKR